MLEFTTNERQNTIKNVIAVRTNYSKPTDQTEIYSDTIKLSTDKTLFKIEFTDASIPINIKTFIEETELNYSPEIIKYSNWYCVIQFNNPPTEEKEVNLNIIGYVLSVNNSNYVLNVNTTGITPDTLENPLIDTEEMAEQYTTWCAEYYEAELEYNLPKVMGDPVLESNDLAYIETDDGKEKLMRVHTVEINFNGTFNGNSCIGRSL